jgi:stage V sporulation protein R
MSEIRAHETNPARPTMPTKGQPLSLETEELTRHKLTVKEFAGSRAAQERLIQEWKHEIEGIVKKACPLDFFPQEFVVVSWQQLQVILAREGFPKRYEHWRFGQAFESQKVKDTYGLGHVYELVINTDPCVAYLLDSNSVQETRTVMAHVYFHNIFFKHNPYFAATDRRMLNKMGEHADRIKRYQEEHGPQEVERFLDLCLSLDNLIDIHSVALRRARDEVIVRSSLERQTIEPIRPARFDVPEYLDRYVNPPDVVKAQVERDTREREKRLKLNPPEPEQDILLFLMKYAPLEPWQQDILSMIRDESYYFAPQRMTKIMNEGWASYWHSKLMTEHLLPLHPCETVDYCDFNAGILRPWGNTINPYRFGVRLLRDIEDRWDKGKFGPDWESCRDMEQRRKWDKKLGLGLEEVIRAMLTHNDLTFIYHYLTPDFCAENKLHVNRVDSDGEAHVSSEDFEKVRAMITRSLTNMGQPMLSVINANHANRGELVVLHNFDGQALDMEYAKATCKNLKELWTRPVHVLTQNEKGEKLALHYAGNGFSVDKLAGEFLSYLPAE